MRATTRLLTSWCNSSETAARRRAATTAVDHARETLHARREGYVPASVADGNRAIRNCSAACSTHLRARRREHAWGAPVTRTKSTSGDQPRFERGREGMGPEACESATGYRLGVFPALATLPQHASPVGGPMGCWVPRRRGTRHVVLRCGCHVAASSTPAARRSTNDSVVGFARLRRAARAPHAVAVD